MTFYKFFLHNDSYWASEAREKERARARSRARRARSRIRELADKRIDYLEEELGFVALVLGSLVERLDKQGVVTRADLEETLKRVDLLDGEGDGRLSIEALRDVAREDLPVLEDEVDDGDREGDD